MRKNFKERERMRRENVNRKSKKEENLSPKTSLFAFLFHSRKVHSFGSIKKVQKADPLLSFSSSFSSLCQKGEKEEKETGWGF